jgi:hypothetical protein
MKTLLSLIKLDRLSASGWFQKEKGWKLFVIILTLSVFTLVSMFIYFISRIFFFNLTQYGIYGDLIVNYIFNAGVILIFWFAVVSSIASSVSFLTINDPQKDYLLTLPVDTLYYLIWNLGKTAIINIFLLIITLFPVVLAFCNSAQIISTVDYWFRFLYISVIIVIASTSIGQLFSYFMFLHLKKLGKFGTVVSTVFFMVFTTVLVQFVFPKNLSTLGEVNTDKFFTIFMNLPLIKLQIPSKILSDTFIYGFSQSSYFLLLGVLLLIFDVIFIGRRKYIELFQTLNDKGGIKNEMKHDSTEVLKIINSQNSLLLKDWLSVIRSQSEAGYALFLFSLIIFFFIFLFRALSFSVLTNSIKIQIFSFVFYLFFSTAFMLRLVFPLMTREGNVIWYLFMLPIKRKRILWSKTIFAVYLSLPLLILSIIIWPLLIRDFTSLIFIDLSWIGILSLSAISVFSGSISPYFELGDDPEKASTTFLGIAALFASLAEITLLSFFLYMIMTSEITIVFGIAVSLVVSILIVFPVFLLARKKITGYSFE